MKEMKLIPVGRIRSPFKKKEDAPYQGRFAEEASEIEIYPEFEAGLKDIESCTHLIVLYWMHEAKRDVLLTQTPHDTEVHGIFATRSPNRPNPIGLSVVELLDREGRLLRVLGLDAIDETPVVDLKPYSAELDAIPHAKIGWFEKAKRRERR